MFEATFRALLETGWIAALAGIAATPCLYYLYPRTPETQRRPFLRYLLGSAAAGCVGYVAGTALGIVIACSTPRGGNLCGLMGLFGLGPLLMGIFTFASACWQIAADSRPGKD